MAAFRFSQAYMTCFLITAVYLAQVDAVQVTAQMTSTGVTGNNATLVCSWVPDSNDILFTLNIKSVSGRKYYTYFIGRDNQPQPQDNPQRNRLSVDSTTQDSASVTMRITGLVCDDEQIYQCQVEYNYLTGATTSNQVEMKNVSLTIRVPPAPPVMDSTSPSNLTGGVAEYSVVTFTCSGNIGKPGPGSVIWKLFRGSVDEELLPSDHRVTTTDVSLLPGEATCSQRLRSVLTMNVSRSDQDLVVACFFRNNGFSQPGSPTTCEDNTRDLCVQTETIRIHYGVRSASASREPQSDLYEGSQVALRCSAEGFPAPTYTWFKVGEEDNILSTSRNGQFTITDLNDMLHGGEYLCNASNTVFGVTYFGSDRINIVVHSELCPKEFCKNGGTCVGLYTCDCSSTDFYGPTCQDTREEIPINDYVFASIDIDNNIVVTSSGNLSFQGSVTLRRQDNNKVSLVIPAGSYVTLDGPVKTSCLGDIDTCTSGFTITFTHSFSSVSSTETLVALTTGAHLEAGVKGVSLYYESGNVNCYVVTSTQEWSIVQKFTLIENKWYNMTVSWHIGQGLDLLQGNDVIGSNVTPDKLPVEATYDKPLLIGSETKTTSNSEMNLQGIITSPVFWKEIQRAGIYFTKEPSSESSSLETAQIVGIAVGCFAVLVFSTVAVVCLVYYIRRDSRNTPQTSGVTSGVKSEDGYITPIDYAYSMNTSNTHNNSSSQDYITPSDYDYITNDYLTLELETTFNNPAPVLPGPRGSIENPDDQEAP